MLAGDVLQRRRIGDRDAPAASADDTTGAPAAQRTRDGGTGNASQAGQFLLSQRHLDHDPALRFRPVPPCDIEEQDSQPLRRSRRGTIRRHRGRIVPAPRDYTPVRTGRAGIGVQERDEPVVRYD